MNNQRAVGEYATGVLLGVDAFVVSTVYSGALQNDCNISVEIWPYPAVRPQTVARRCKVGRIN
jgi:hypothetical protein